MYFSREWLGNKLASLTDDEEKLWIKISFLSSAADLLPDVCTEIRRDLSEIADRTNDNVLRAYVLIQGTYAEMIANRLGDFEAVMREATRLIEGAPPSTLSGMVMQMQAFAYWTAGFRDKALALSYDSRKVMIKVAGESLGWIDYQLAVFHSDLREYDVAQQHFDSAEKQAAAIEAIYQLARIRSGQAAIAIAQNRMDDAMRLNEMALTGYRDCGHFIAMSRALNDLGVIYARQGDHVKAKKYLAEAMEIRRKSNYLPGLTTTQMELARILMLENDPDGAQQLLEDALKISVTMKARQKAITCHSMLSEIHKTKKNYQAALGHFEQSYAIKSELSGEEASNRIKQLQQKHATEQAEQEAEIHRLKNVELKRAYDAIEYQNKSILDSINYARRIQTALLGSRNLLAKHLAQSFVLYKPKDIVSGDFWWCVEQNDEFYFAVADCTGHGVPGAFMSLLNINILNRALSENENAHPALLLNEARTQVIKSLNREGNEQSRDGMDAVLCSINKSGQLRFACANNALVHVRNGQAEIHGPDKFPVGLAPTAEMIPFTGYEIQLQKGDAVYLTTDGFADQFGGSKGKKFRQKRLRELLLQHSALPLAEQESILEREFESWRGNLEQVDDVLVLGFRW